MRSTLHKRNSSETLITKLNAKHDWFVQDNRKLHGTTRRSEMTLNANLYSRVSHVNRLLISSNPSAMTLQQPGDLGWGCGVSLHLVYCRTKIALSAIFSVINPRRSARKERAESHCPGGLSANAVRCVDVWNTRTHHRWAWKICQTMTHR